MSEPSTPAAGAAATPTSAGTQSAQTPNGEAPAPAVEEAAPKRSHQVTIQPRNGQKVVTFLAKDKPGPKAAKPAPAAGESSPKDTAGKADASAPAPASGSKTDPTAKSSSPEQPAKSSASDPKAAPTTEPAKPTEKTDAKPPLSKGWAQLLERESQVTKKEGELKSEFAPFVEARELAKTSKLKAIEKAFGWTLEDLQNEYMQGLEGTLSPEQIAERTARKVIEDREAAAAKKRDDDAKAEEERARTEVRQKIDAATADLIAIANTLPPAEMEAINLYGCIPAQTLKHWADTHQGELPTDFAAAIKAHEAFLQERLKAAGFAKPAAAPPPQASQANPTTPTVVPRAKASPTTITSEDTGAVPIAPRQRKETAMERAQRLVAERLRQQVDATN